MNEVRLSLQGEQHRVFLTNDDISVFKEKLEFWKIVFASDSLMAS